jgi:hypothetical protein
MIKYPNTTNSPSELGAVTARALSCRGRAHGAQVTRHPRIARACKATALASSMIVGSTVLALAAEPDVPPPAPDKLWGGCVLDEATVAGLIRSVGAGNGLQQSTAEVSFVVVYTLDNDNDGQPLSGSGSNFTGPVICTNPQAVNITAFAKDRSPLKEITDIPTQTDPGNATSADILESEEALILQYRLNNGGNAGDIEKRVCHTTEGNVDCFRIFPVAP